MTMLSNRTPVARLRTPLGLALSMALVLAAAACDGPPPQAPGDGDNVQIDLTPFFSGFSNSKSPCSEADLVRLRVTELSSGRVQNFSAPVPPCTATFTVTVEGGPTEFISLVTGDDRPLLADIDTIDIRSDGWNAPIQLQPISALLVTVDTSADTTGVAADLSYTYTVTTEESGTSDPFPIAADSTDVRFALSAGDVGVQLFGFGSCDVNPDSIQTVTLQPDSLRVGAVTFGVDCNAGGMGPPSGPTGAVRVTTTTTGTGGPNPYRLTVAGRDTTIGLNDTVVVSLVPIGNQPVEIENAGTCSVMPSSQQTAPVTESDTTDIAFAIDAVLPCGEIGSIEVITTTTGGGGPYDFTIDGGPTMPIAADDTVRVDTILVGMHTVELLNFGSCTVSPDSIQTVDVAAGSASQVMYAVDCAGGGGGSGAIGVITSTSGPDPGGYEFRIPPDTIGTIAANDTAIVGGLAPGPRSVLLVNTAPCLVTSANPDSVTVSAGDTVFVTFDIECSPQIQVRTFTVGSDLDPDGYTATVVDSAQSQPIGISDSVVFQSVSPGSHTVQLTGVASNCIVVLGNTRTAVVGAIGTTTVQFLVECFPQTSLAPDLSSELPARLSGGERTRLRDRGWPRRPEPRGRGSS